MKYEVQHYKENFLFSWFCDAISEKDARRKAIMNNIEPVRIFRLLSIIPQDETKPRIDFDIIENN